MYWTSVQLWCFSASAKSVTMGNDLRYSKGFAKCQNSEGNDKEKRGEARDQAHKYGGSLEPGN